MTFMSQPFSLTRPMRSVGPGFGGLAATERVETDVVVYFVSADVVTDLAR
jgi:hypothetical protein